MSEKFQHPLGKTLRGNSGAYECAGIYTSPHMQRIARMQMEAQHLVKVRASWSKPEGIPHLIGRKHVDWSIFESGTTIPQEFHEDFASANGGALPMPGERIDVSLIVEGDTYPALLQGTPRDGGIELQLRYDGGRELKGLLRKRFQASHEFIRAEREAKSDGGSRKVFAKTDPTRAEYLDFYATGTPYSYRVEMVTSPAGATVEPVVPTPQEELAVAQERIGTLLESILVNGTQLITPGAPAQAPVIMDLFRSLHAAVSDCAAVKRHPTLKVKWSAGLGRWAKIPWLALLDSRETASTKSGVYCVFLFCQDMSGVYLAFSQGVTEPTGRLGNKTGLEWLSDNAGEIREQCEVLEHRGFALDGNLNLHTDQGLGKQYEAATIAYKLYRRDAIPGDVEIVADVEAILSAYDRYLGDEQMPPNEEPPAVEPDLDLTKVCLEFSTALQASHIYFGEHHHDQLIRAFISALATKRLAILTGLSGSGKTQIAIRFGQWLGDQRSMLIPVRPDWTGAEALFGYEDALQKRSDDGRPAWHVPDALAFMLKAAGDQANPYLLILDEMNLAHVERYFADVLSGMESDQACLPNLWQESGTWRPVAGGPARIRFPRNLFIVGTVNVDETTYMFSPKVLDRANTFEFRVEPGDLRTDLQKPVDCAPGDLAFVRGFLAVARDDQWQVDNQPDGLEQYTAHLKTLHALLYEGGFEFGHRVFYEAVRFAAMMQSAGNHEMEHVLDLQLMQKVLPRLHGTRRRLEATLCALGGFCYELTFETGSVEGGKGTQFNLQAKPEKTPRLPRSFDKVKRMYRNLLINQFTSFTE